MSMSMSMLISSKITEGLRKMIVEIISSIVHECGTLNNIEAYEMLRALNINEVCVGVGVGVKKEKIVKEKSEKINKSFPMPFNGVIKEVCCRGLRQNQGLYTQCEVKVDVDSNYCKKCDMMIFK